MSSEKIDPSILHKMQEISDQFFRSRHDPDQMPANDESYFKLQRLHPKTLLYKTENGEPISWIVVVPTTKELADQFLNGGITERELLDLTEPQDRYDAIYLCSAFTVPEHRGKGLTTGMFKQAVNEIPHTEDVKLFSWPFSEAGLALAKKLEIALVRDIKLKI